MTDDRLPVRTPGQALRIEGELALIEGGWFGTDQTTAQHISRTDDRPSYALMQRTLNGLQRQMTAEPSEPDPSAPTQE